MQSVTNPYQNSTFSGALSSKKSVLNVRRSSELSNHLGNVLAVISDKPIPHDNSGTADYWLADIRQSSDYSPFGVQLSGRNFTLTNAKEYRMGFQGQEEDDEIKGEGNSVNYKYRMHDPRLGRFFAIDPLASKYPHNSVYAFSENDVIGCVELEGLEKVKLATNDPKTWATAGQADYSNQQSKPPSSELGQAIVGQKARAEEKKQAQINDYNKNPLKYTGIDKPYAVPIPGKTVPYDVDTETPLGTDIGTINGVAGPTLTAVDGILTDDIIKTSEYAPQLRQVKIVADRLGPIGTVIDAAPIAYDMYENGLTTENLTETFILTAEVTVIDRMLTSGVPHLMLLGGGYYAIKAVLTIEGTPLPDLDMPNNWILLRDQDNTRVE